VYKEHNPEIGEDVYKMTSESRKFIQSEAAREFIESLDDHSTLNMGYYRFLRYYAKLGRQYIRNLKKYLNIDFPLIVTSGAIDEGLFGKPVYTALSLMSND